MNNVAETKINTSWDFHEKTGWITRESSDFVKEEVNGILCPFMDMAFWEWDDIDVFLEKIEAFYEDIDLEKIKNFNDLKVFMDLIDDILLYISNNTKEIKEQSPVILMNFKKIFRLIHQVVWKLPKDENFIRRILKWNDSISDNSLSQLLNMLYIRFEPIYYNIIQVHGKENLPNYLKTDYIIDSIESWKFESEDSVFYNMITNIEEKCKYILKTNSWEFNLKQLEEVKENIEKLFNAINIILEKPKLNIWKKITLNSIVDEKDGYISKTLLNLDKLILEEKDRLKQKVLKEEAIDMIKNLPVANAKGLAKNTDRFDLYLNEVRYIISFIMWKNWNFNDINDNELWIIKALLISIYEQMDKVLKFAKKEWNKKISYNAEKLISKKPAKIFWEIWQV